jgi:hypothetical protein
VSTIITLVQQQDKKTIGDGNCAFHSALRDKYESTIRGLLGKLVREDLDASDRLFFEEARINRQPILNFIQTKSQEIFARGTTPNNLLKLLDPDYKKRFKTLKTFFAYCNTYISILLYRVMLDEHQHVTKLFC